jgi:hypothetical protein
MKKWEYRLVTAVTMDFEEELNLLGVEGWELVFVTAMPGTAPIQLVAVLKREGQEHPHSEVSVQSL